MTPTTDTEARCTNCGAVFDYQPDFDFRVPPCPDCGGRVVLASEVSDVAVPRADTGGRDASYVPPAKR